MHSFHLLLAALTTSAALAADPCQCVNVDQKIDPVSNPIIFFQHPTVTGEMNGVPCSANCLLKAHLDVDDEKYALEIQLLSNDLKDGKLAIKGLSEDVTITSKTLPGFIAPKSTGDSISIEFTQPAAMKAEFLMAIRKVPRPATPKSFWHRIWLLVFQMILALLTLLICSHGVLSEDCKCVGVDQKIDPTNNPILFFQQPTTTGEINGKTCSANCTFQAHLDTDDKKYSLQVQIINNALLDGKITIEGLEKDVTITSNKPTGVLEPTSYSDSITIKFVQPAGMKAEFMLAVKKVEGRPETPPFKQTTLSPSTPPYDHKFTSNPLLVSNDIMFAFDMGSEFVEEYKKFATGIIDQLSIRPKDTQEDCGAGSRLSLIGLSSMDGFSNLYAPYWTTSAAQAKGNINSIVRLSNDKFNINPVGDYLEGFRNPQTSCENRGRLFVLLTSSLPKEYSIGLGDNKANTFEFVEDGIHQIIVNYKSKKEDLAYYNDYKDENAENEWNFFSLSGNTDDDVTNFINTFLVDSSAEMTCQPSTLDVAVGKDEKTVSIPPYYSGRRGEDGETRDNWKTAKHYCNFQKTIVALNRDKDVPQGTPICLTVYYDLEADRDYVKIYSGDAKDPEMQELVVHLTGRDVSGTTFELPDALGSIVFSSDEKNVFDGFHAKIVKC